MFNRKKERKKERKKAVGVICRIVDSQSLKKPLTCHSQSQTPDFHTLVLAVRTRFLWCWQPWNNAAVKILLLLVLLVMLSRQRTLRKINLLTAKDLSFRRKAKILSLVMIILLFFCPLSSFDEKNIVSLQSWEHFVVFLLWGVVLHHNKHMYAPQTSLLLLSDFEVRLYVFCA